MVAKVSIWLWVVTVLALVVASVALVAGLTKRHPVAFVKIGPLLEKYQGMIDAKAVYKGQQIGWQANVDTLASEFQRELRAFEQKRRSMSPKERELAEQLLQSKQQQAMQYRESLQRKAQEEDRKLTEQVLKKVNAYLERYGKKSPYDLILGANPSGNILYGREAVDITDDVLEGLNAEYKAANPPAASQPKMP